MSVCVLWICKRAGAVLNRRQDDELYLLPSSPTGSLIPLKKLSAGKSSLSTSTKFTKIHRHLAAWPVGRRRVTARAPPEGEEQGGGSSLGNTLWPKHICLHMNMCEMFTEEGIVGSLPAQKTRSGRFPQPRARAHSLPSLSTLQRLFLSSANTDFHS